MNGSILDEIRLIRRNENLNINRKNRSRYRLLINEDDSSTTAYYFSTPIYNIKSRRLVDPCFRREGDIFTAYGSSASINVNRGEIFLKNDEARSRGDYRR